MAWPKGVSRKKVEDAPDVSAVVAVELSSPEQTASDAQTVKADAPKTLSQTVVLLINETLDRIDKFPGDTRWIAVKNGLEKAAFWLKDIEEKSHA